MTYIPYNKNVDRQDKKLDRNIYNKLRRKLFWNTWLWIKTSANQNLHFSMISIF